VAINWTKGGKIELFLDKDAQAAVTITYSTAKGWFSADTVDTFSLEPGKTYHASRIHHIPGAGKYSALHKVVITPDTGTASSFDCNFGECRVGFGN
jgi:hypothetical protein